MGYTFFFFFLFFLSWVQNQPSLKSVMLCGRVCLRCSLCTKHRCQGNRGMQINTEQWNTWIPMRIMVEGVLRWHLSFALKKKEHWPDYASTWTFCQATSGQRTKQEYVTRFVNMAIFRVSYFASVCRRSRPSAFFHSRRGRFEVDARLSRIFQLPIPRVNRFA